MSRERISTSGGYSLDCDSEMITDTSGIITKNCKRTSGPYGWIKILRVSKRNGRSDSSMSSCWRHVAITYTQSRTTSSNRIASTPSLSR